MPRIHTCLRPENDDGLVLPRVSCDCERRFRHVKDDAAEQFIGGDLGGVWKQKRDKDGNLSANKNIILLPAEESWLPARTISQREMERAFAFARENNYNARRIVVYGETVEEMLFELGAAKKIGVTKVNEVIR